MILIDGKGLSSKIKDELRCEIESNKKLPCLAVITIGENESSKVYVRNKKRSCEQVGIGFIHLEYDDKVEESKVIKKIHELNKDNNVNGILLQLPLPKGYDEKRILNEISCKKDVDGLTEKSIGQLSLDDCVFVPCTAKGIMKMLDYYNIDLATKHVVVVGRSSLVGKPTAIECLKKNATVTVCHSKTEDLPYFTKQADILIVATGNKYLIDENMIKKDVVIIDVGINKVDDKIYGDVNPNVESKCSYLSPVPGGVGPMTVAMLLVNTYIAFKNQNGL